MNVADAIKTRRSIRAFTDREVSVETLRSLLEEARRAPSGGNLQPWRVYVLHGEVRERFVEMIGEKMKTEPGGEGTEYDVYPPDLVDPYRSRRSRNGQELYELLGIERSDRTAKLAHFARNYRFFDAPVGLIFTMDRIMQVGQWADLGMFMQSIMLLATGQGLATCPQESWAVWHKSIREFCRVPDNEMIFCGMAIGYADEKAPVNGLITERADVEEFTCFVS